MKKGSDSVLVDMLSTSVDFCKTNNIRIEDEQIQEMLLRSIDVRKIVSECFSQRDGVDLEKIQLHVTSAYSITRFRVSKMISRLIVSMNKKINHIIDGNANVGSTAIEFAYNFERVDAVEIDQSIFVKLKSQ